MRTNASFGEAVTGAVLSLRGSKLRSFLTLLGIILATTTLIAVMSVIDGMNVYVSQQVSTMGADGFKVARLIMMGVWDPKKFLEMQRRNPELSKEEYEFLRSHSKLVDEIGMSVSRTVSVHYGKEHRDNIQLTGATANEGVLSDIEPAEGRFISDLEDGQRSFVAVIGNDLKDQFFAAADPIGKSIMVEGRPFEVIGVAKTKGSVFGNSRDNFLMIPAETYFKIYGARSGITYDLKAADQTVLQQSEDEIRVLLRAYRHLHPKDEDTFGMVSSDSLVGVWNQLTGAIAATAVGVVSVFMVVGGVVIMNIMLAVVTERTREIGIRKSVGARRSDILNQFLVESSILSATGGLIGIMVAWIVALLVKALTPVPMHIPISAVIVGVTLSAAVGLFFGIYPARRAAGLDPIEALRVER
ncbi:MAG TPA: ABC transporter permease [Bryobacteraceae bacterium]|jgi:putative ABC transport system permease protein|nr:ABC transporter permease [Bryobacteraceae bacterium]